MSFSHPTNSNQDQNLFQPISNYLPPPQGPALDGSYGKFQRNKTPYLEEPIVWLEMQKQLS